MEGLKQSPVIGIGIGEFSCRGGFVVAQCVYSDFYGIGHSRGHTFVRAVLLLCDEPVEPGVAAGHRFRL